MHVIHFICLSQVLTLWEYFIQTQLWCSGWGMGRNADDGDDVDGNDVGLIDIF